MPCLPCRRMYAPTAGSRKRRLGHDHWWSLHGLITWRRQNRNHILIIHWFTLDRTLIFATKHGGQMSLPYLPPKIMDLYVPPPHLTIIWHLSQPDELIPARLTLTISNVIPAVLSTLPHHFPPTSCNPRNSSSLFPKPSKLATLASIIRITPSPIHQLKFITPIFQLSNLNTS